MTQPQNQLPAGLP